MKSLKLNSIKKNSLIKEELKNIIGCTHKITCICGCRGGDSTIANGYDNKKGGLYDPYGGVDFTNYKPVDDKK